MGGAESMAREQQRMEVALMPCEQTQLALEFSGKEIYRISDFIINIIAMLHNRHANV